MLPVLLALLGVLQTAFGCTNLMVSNGASVDGSNLIAYNADAGNFYTTIYHYPASTDNVNVSRKTYSWDYGTYLGEIPEALETYNVAGNVNEYGVVIMESTFGGLVELTCDKRTGLIDYGSLIYLTLQRSRTAREAILKMDWLLTNYGYASEGESFSIADQNELWVMDLIGKGKFGKGAVWVARRVPNGYVSGHANQARITTFPQGAEANTDTSDTYYSADAISFARDQGLYEGDDADFDFSGTYDPITFSGARFCEARVWSFFSTVMGQEWSDEYLSYASGYDLTNRMPLWVKPADKLSAADVMEAMRNHYEGTALQADGTSFNDVGAGAFHSPNRNSPLQWSAPSYPGKTFFNERTIGQGATGWSIVGQSRPNFPREMAAVLWFGMDDSSTSVHFPVYGSALRISEGWAGQGPQDGVTPPMMTFSLNSAFYVFNLVANYAYTRWEDIYPDVHAEILKKEAGYFAALVDADAKGKELIESGATEEAVEYLTTFSVSIGDALLTEWFTFFGQLFVKFRDGYVTTASPKIPICACSQSSLPYNEEWYDRVATDTGDHYVEPEGAGDDEYYSPLRKEESSVSGSKKFAHGHASIAKKDLRAFQ